jgi:hypothetical protein
MAKPLTLTFDKTSARRYDENGFLHVSGCNISKATVNPYLGAEIPNWEKLGLDPGKLYQILRPADALTKAAMTCNMIPLMDAHIEVSALDLENPDIARHRVGSTGQVGEFKAPYLVNDLVITNAGAIQGVESKDQCELSCAYRYDIVMTPGEYEGTKYDGYMENISFNHVALVEEGRAGPDVMVRDSKGKIAADIAELHRQLLRSAMKPGYASAVEQAIKASGIPAQIRVALAQDYIEHMPGHKDSSGKPAPYVVKKEGTNKVLWSGGSRAAAKQALGRISSYSKDEEDCMGVGSVTRDIERREDISSGEVKSRPDIPYADPVNKRYKLDTRKHVKAAASYFGMPDNRAKYSKQEQKEIDGRIDVAEKRLKIGKYAKATKP